MAYRHVHILVCQHTTQHTDISEYRCRYDALSEDEPQYVPRFGPDGLTYPELTGPLLYSDEHDVRHSDNPTQQSEQPDYPQRFLDDVYALRHLDIVKVAVPDEYRALVVRGSIMLRVKLCTVILLKLLALLPRCHVLQHKLYLPGIITLRIDCLQRAVWDDRRVVLLHLVILQYAYDKERKLVYTDTSAYKRSVIAGQLLSLGLSQHNHLAALIDVNVIDKTPRQNLTLVYLPVCRCPSAKSLFGNIFVFVRDIHARLGQCASYILCVIGECLLRHHDIPVQQFYGTALLHTFIWL